MEYPTQQLPQPQPEPQPGSPRRRSWVLPAVFGALLLTGVLAAAAVLAGPSSIGRDADRMEISEAANLDELLEPAADLGDDELAVPGGEARDRPPFKHGRKGHGPLRLREGEKVLAGSVGSVTDGKLVVRKDNGAEVTVPTDGDTKVRGGKDRKLADLQAGQRVVVRVGSDGVADGVLPVRAHAAGTVTKLEGDRATVVRPGGLSTELDLSGVSERPAVGTVVVAVGTATDDGAILKVEQIRELPTVG